MGDSKALTADDPLYRDVFDIAKEATHGHRMVFDDMAERLNALRDKGAIHKGIGSVLAGDPDDALFQPPRETYTLTTFELVNWAFRDGETFSNEIYRDLAMVHAMGDTILWKTGPDHQRLRAVAQPMFIGPKTVTWWRRNWIDEIVAKLLEPLEALETTDLNLSFCARLPMQVITQGFGMNGEAALEFRNHLLHSTGALPATPEQKKTSSEVVNEMLKELITERRKKPQDDVVSGLLRNDLALEGEGSRKLTDEEVFAYCRLVMGAGGGTTWRQLGMTLVALLTNDFWDACLKDRDLVPAAVEESIRWIPTDPFMPRLVTRDVEIAGWQIPAGARVDLCLGAANRDPARWENPDAYDIHRPYQYNLGTAIGPHRCLGYDLTRTEMVWAINGLLDRFPKMRLDPDTPTPRFIGGTHQRGIDALHVLLK